jgi:hypothetical protein
MEKHRLVVEMRGSKAHEMTVTALDADDAEYIGLLRAFDRYSGTVKNVRHLSKV